jgi:hypothetical protein
MVDELPIKKNVDKVSLVDILKLTPAKHGDSVHPPPYKGFKYLHEILSCSLQYPLEG